MTEDQLTENIRELARLFGVLVFHVRDSRGSIGPGFPDLVLTGRGGTLFRELKSARSRLTDSQWRWGEYLTLGGENWKVWRAADWPHVIRAEMEAISGRSTR